MRFFATVLLALWTALPVAAQKTLEPAGLLEEARSAALVYSASLPDFLCTERVQRQEDLNGTGRWRRIDTLTVRLSYFEHKEDYKLMTIDGKSTGIEFLKVGGPISTGEFGSRLVAVFLPDSKAAFEWKGWAKMRGRRVAIYRFHIAKENSTFNVQSAAKSVIAGYHGELAIDEETRRVLRLSSEGEMPVGFPVRTSASTVEYDFRKVGGTAFLLPVRASSSMLQSRQKLQNDVEFHDYRKFHSESTLSFASEDEKTKK